MIRRGRAGTGRLTQGLGHLGQRFEHEQGAEHAGPEPGQQVEAPAPRQVLAHALVHALVAPAQEDQAVAAREARRRGLVEGRPLRAEQDGARARRRVVPLHRLHRREERRGHQDHPAASAVGSVVHLVVPVRRVLSQIVHAHGDDPAVPRPSQDAARERSLEHGREGGDHVEFHQSSRSPSGGSMVIHPPALSMSVQIERAAGTRTSFRPRMAPSPRSGGQESAVDAIEQVKAMPIAFEANAGQTNPAASFVARAISSSK